MKPSVGRIVHYVNTQGEHCAAIVTRVFSDTCVNLTVFGSDNMTYGFTSILFNEGATAGSWHWPERVE